jgi:hypothetical protein
MAVPGLEQHNQIRESLPSLSRQARTAFAVACAARVLPVLEDYYGEARVECRDALDLAWRYALGEDPPEAEIKATIAACEAMVDELYDADEDGATMYALNAISYALQTTQQAESKTADLAMSNASDAAHTSDIDHGDDHINEEADWHLLAYDVARRASAISRDMFAHLPAPPKWLGDFYANRAVNAPIP